MNKLNKISNTENRKFKSVQRLKHKKKVKVQITLKSVEAFETTHFVPEIVSLCSSIVLFSTFLLLHLLSVRDSVSFCIFPLFWIKESPKHVHSISLTENARTRNEISSLISCFRKRNETIRSVAIWNPRVGIVL